MTNGREALERILAGTRYDVILCDLMMPQMTGMEVHEAILRIDRRRRAAWCSSPAARSRRARAIIESVPNQRIEKPFDLKGLRNLVNELIR